MKRPRFGAGFVVLFSLALAVIIGSVWVFRSFGDALRVAGVGLPAIVAAVLAWGLSEMSRRDERQAQERRFDREQKLQDQRLRDDREHERRLRRAEVAERELVDYRAFQRRTLEQLGPAVDAFTSTGSTLTERTYLALLGLRPHNQASVDEFNTLNDLAKTQLSVISELMSRLEDAALYLATNQVLEPMSEGILLANETYKLAEIGRITEATIVERHQIGMSKINDVSLAQGRLTIQGIGPALRLLYRPVMTEMPDDEASGTPAGGREVAPATQPSSPSQTLNVPPPTSGPAPDTPPGPNDGSPQ